MEVKAMVDKSQINNVAPDTLEESVQRASPKAKRARTKSSKAQASSPKTSALKSSAKVGDSALEVSASMAALTKETSVKDASKVKRARTKSSKAQASSPKTSAIKSSAKVGDSALEVSKARTTKPSKQASKGSEGPLDEEVMRAHARKALDFSAQVLLVPMRHHSMAMSLHLQRIIEAYQPDFIAVEMPSECQEQIQFLANPKVVPPIGLFSYGISKAKCLMPKDASDPLSPVVEQAIELTYRNICPLLAYSPEYVAFKAALERGIDYQCIDLSSSEQSYLDNVVATASKTRGASAGAAHECVYAATSDTTPEVFEHSAYYRRVTEQSGSLSFEEFWDKHFEINALGQDSLSYLENLYSYCYSLRQGIDESADIALVQRELSMLKHLKAAIKKYQHILVLTGGIHAVGLCDYLYHKKPKAKALKLPKTKGNCFLVPFPLRADDAHSYYASGVIFPYYYQQLYKAINESLSFAPSTKLIALEAQDAAGGVVYEACAQEPSNFKHWHEPLAALQTSKERVAFNATDAESLGDKEAQSQTAQTLLSLGTLNEQAKIKDMQEMRAQVLKRSKQLKSESEKNLKESSGELLAQSAPDESASSSERWSAAQQAALLAFKVDPKHLSNAALATNFFFASSVCDYRQHQLNTAEQIDCQVMLKGLAALRAKVVPSVFELIDAIKSTFIKEELHDDNYMLLSLFQHLTSVPLGQVPLEVNVPPLWRDFVTKAKAFALKSEDNEIHQAHINIFKDAKNVQKGRFFAQVAFLCPNFLYPSYSLQPNQSACFNYVKRTETYTYRYSHNLVMDIVHASELGNDLPSACERQLTLILKHYLSLVELCNLLKQCVDMGIEKHFSLLHQHINNTVAQEHQLLAIGEALDILHSYAFAAKTTEQNQQIIRSLIDLVLKRALEVMAGQMEVVEDELDDYLACLMSLNYYFGKYQSWLAQYCALLKELSCDESIGSTLQGAYVSLLFKNKQISYAEFEHYVNQFVYGAIMRNNDCIGFFYSVLAIARSSIFYRNGILQLLDTYIDSLQGEEFLKVLVMLKRSFASFSHDEIYKVITMLKQLHGGMDPSTLLGEVSAAVVALNRQADSRMLAALQHWLPLHLDGISTEDLSSKSLSSK